MGGKAAGGAHAVSKRLASQLIPGVVEDAGEALSARLSATGRPRWGRHAAIGDALKKENSIRALREAVVETSWACSRSPHVALWRREAPRRAHHAGPGWKDCSKSLLPLGAVYMRIDPNAVRAEEAGGEIGGLIFSTLARKHGRPAGASRMSAGGRYSQPQF